MTTGEFWRRIKYSRAIVVDSRAALDAALARAPRYILVEGSEALRAYAASLAYRGGQEAAQLEVAGSRGELPAYMMLPTVGRIRDGYRPRHSSARRARDGKPGHWLPPGMDMVLVAAGGLVAALLGEWLSYSSADQDIAIGRPAGRLPGHAGPAQLPAHAPAHSLHALAIQLVSVSLLMLAAAALAYLVWQAAGAGRAPKVSWRVEHRIQGRLVIARIRTSVG